MRILPHPGNFEVLNYTLIAVFFEKITFGGGWGIGENGCGKVLFYGAKFRSIVILTDFYVPKIVIFGTINPLNTGTLD